MKTAEIGFYIRALKNEECQCGRSKKSGYAVCFECYRRLPRDMQTALYRPINRGFQEAYEAAVKHLNT